MSIVYREEDVRQANGLDHNQWLAWNALYTGTEPLTPDLSDTLRTHGTCRDMIVEAIASWVKAHPEFVAEVSAKAQ